VEEVLGLQVVEVVGLEGGSLVFAKRNRALRISLEKGERESDLTNCG